MIVEIKCKKTDINKVNEVILAFDTSDTPAFFAEMEEDAQGNVCLNMGVGPQAKQAIDLVLEGSKPQKPETFAKSQATFNTYLSKMSFRYKG